MKKNFLLGILLILFGTSMLLRQLGIWDVGNLNSTWWPMILIAFGLKQLTSRPVSKTSAIVLTL